MKYTDDELKGIVDRAFSSAVGAPDSEVAEARERNLLYYLATPEGELAPPEVDDRSDIVASDVADTVEWMLPSLLRPFVSSKESIQAKAKKPQAEPQAKFVGEVIKHYFWEKCDGFNVLYNWSKDALIQKVGHVSVGWEKYTDESEETYRGLTEAQVGQLLADPEVEPVSQEEQETMTPMGQMVVYNVTLKRTQELGRHVIDVIPPEEMRLDASAVYGGECRFIGREYYRTKGQLDALGYDTSNMMSGEDWDEESRLRQEQQTKYNDNDIAEETQRIKCQLAYVLLDQDEDGKPEWLKLLVAGGELVENETVDDHPFVAYCPSPLPHVYYGNCPADFAIEPQRFRTRLIRAVEDNIYLTVNQRTGVVNPSQTMLDDLLNNRPGGVVRMDRQDQMMPIVQGQLGGDAWQAVEWAEQWLEKRTGFSRMSKGLGADALQDTATAALEITERADMRTELAARHLADSLKKLLRKLLKCLSMYQDVPTQARINGQWADVDPRGWHNLFDVEVSVGLGSANRDRQMASFARVQGLQAQLAGAGMVPEPAVIALARKIAQGEGLEDVEQYFPDPQKKQPQPGPMEIETMKAQIKAQSDAQAEQMRAQIERERMQMQTQVDTHRQQVEAEQQQARAQLEMQLEQFKAEKQAQIEQMRAEYAMRTAIAVAEVNANAGLMRAQVQAQSVATAEQDAAADAAVKS